MKKNFLIVATAFIFALFALTVLGLTPELVAAAANSSDAGISSGAKLTCLIVDVTVLYFVVTIFSLIGGLVVSKYLI